MADQPEDSATKFIRMFKDVVRPELAREIPDQFFRPGQEVELQKRVEQVIDSILVRDKVPIGRQLRLKFIESVLADIGQASQERFPSG